MKLLSIIVSLLLPAYLVAGGTFKVHKKESFQVADLKGDIEFIDLKAKLSGKLTGKIRNNSSNYYKWIWFDFERFDKDNIRTTVSKSYPQILFEDIEPNSIKKIKNLSLGGVKWLKTYNFGEVIALEFDIKNYIKLAQELDVPILIKYLGINNNKRLSRNEIVINWINTSKNLIQKIEYTLVPLNKLGETIANEPLLSYEFLDSSIYGIETKNAWRSWDNQNVSCVKVSNILISYKNGATKDIQGSDLQKILYKPENNLFPSQSIRIVNCMKLISKK